MSPRRIPISAAKRLAQEQGLEQVIVVAWDGKRTHVVTYGTTVKACQQAAAGGNKVKRLFGFPEEMCNTQPARSRRIALNSDTDGGKDG